MTTTTVQLKLRGIFLPNDSPETLTNSVNDIFSDITSTVSNFFYNLVNVFNQKFPPEDRDELIHRLFSGSTPYLIVLVVLITWLCCWCCLSRRSSERMMRAPGRFPRMISRPKFEGNPSGYFRGLRGQSNNFVY
ncbi:SAM and SH3 domain-containing protein [Tanacetum coccineum]